MAAPIPTVAEDASVVAASPEPQPAPIEDASVRRTDIGPGVAEMRGRFRACYNRGLLSDPTLEGGLVLDVTIGPDGSVTSVVTKQNTLPLDVTVCLEKVMRTLLIDPPDASVRVSIPIRFVPP